MKINDKLSSFDELFEREEEAYRHTVSMDLLYVRTSIRLIDGWCLIFGPNETYELEIVMLTKEQYNTFTDGTKDYLKRHFGVEA